MTRRTGDARRPTWYKDAIIYEVRARSFFDSNDDGDRRLPGSGRASSTTCRTWASPRSGCCRSTRRRGRDDGYDIADYTDVHPDVGTLADFEHLLAEAHRRGLRVITELVLNHTSDQHPWFQRARRAPPGSTERDFYVWSDTPDRYQEARIIFKDFEPSNWAWDRQANAYYWHRFYAHQPDLNFENPAVHEAHAGRRRLLARQGRRRPAPRRRPVPVRGGGHELREPARDPRVPAQAARARRREVRRTGCSSPRPTSGPRTPPPTSATATSAT